MLLRRNYPPLKIDSLLNNSQQKTKVLFVYPHPDDETMASGGLISILAKDSRFEVKTLNLTWGDKGTILYKLPPDELGQIRHQELIEALKILGVTNYDSWNLGDGKLEKEESQLKNKIRSSIEKFKPDVVVTYEKWGLYGHPDHVVTSKVIHELHMSKEFEFKALYSTLPREFIKKIGLPTSMAKDESKLAQTKPEFRLNLGFLAVVTKFKAARKHKSQALTKGKNILFWPIFGGYEYYTTQYPAGSM